MLPEWMPRIAATERQQAGFDRPQFVAFAGD